MNLFDVTHGIALPGQNKPKPRPANENEIKAYLIWLADRRGIWLPHDAEYGVRGVYSKSADGFVLEMPGYGQDQCVTMETLDESGEVVASQTLPVEPKKGGVIWDKAAVRKACGPVAKPAKGKRAKVAEPIPDAAPAPVAVEPQEVSAPTCDKPETVETLPAAPAVDLEAIAARIEALEAAVATLSRSSADALTARAKRSPAHERAIRRAWAERKARRNSLRLHIDQLDNANERVKRWRSLAEAESERANNNERNAKALQEKCEEWEALQHRTWTESMGHKVKRKRAAATARRMIAAARAQERIATAKASAARAEIDRLKRDMADPTTPDRASDVARLVRERDEARTALAAVTERAKRAEQAVESMADRFTSLVSRVTKAEAALRERVA